MMKNSRRQFLKQSGLLGLSLAGGKAAKGLASGQDSLPVSLPSSIGPNMKSMKQKDETLSLIGQYGQWAAALTDNKLPTYSFRRKAWSDLQKWGKTSGPHFSHFFINIWPSLFAYNEKA